MAPRRRKPIPESEAFKIPGPDVAPPDRNKAPSNLKMNEDSPFRLENFTPGMTFPVTSNLDAKLIADKQESDLSKSLASIRVSAKNSKKGKGVKATTVKLPDVLSAKSNGAKVTKAAKSKAITKSKAAKATNTTSTRKKTTKKGRGDNTTAGDMDMDEEMLFVDDYDANEMEDDRILHDLNRPKITYDLAIR